MRVVLRPIPASAARAVLAGRAPHQVVVVARSVVAHCARGARGPFADPRRYSDLMPDAELIAVLEAGVGYDAEELADLTERLGSELRDLDVDSVAAAADGEAPEGAKGIELLGIGGLVVRFALRAEVLRSVAHTAAAWLGRQQARSVKLTLDGDTLEVTGISSDEQSALIEVWVARHARDG